MKKMKKNVKRKARTTSSIYFDKLNKELQFRFQVKNVNYILNNGIINKGWLIANEKGIDDAIILLKKQKAPIYILGKNASVVVGWDMIRSIIVGSIWKDGKKIDEIESIDFNDVKKALVNWYSQVMGE